MLGFFFKKHDTSGFNKPISQYAKTITLDQQKDPNSKFTHNARICLEFFAQEFRCYIS